MKKTGILKKIICFLLILLILIIIVLGFFYVQVMRGYSKLPCSKELARSYILMDLKQFDKGYIRNYDEQKNLVIIGFFHKKLGEFSSDECVEDIIKIRDKTIEILKNNPDNELNNKRIIFDFNFRADESMMMCNYDYETGEFEENCYSFLYFNHLEISDMNILKPLSDAKKISFSYIGKNSDFNDEVSAFDDFKNLQYLSGGFSPEMIAELEKRHPGCDVVNKYTKPFWEFPIDDAA